MCKDRKKKKKEEKNGCKRPSEGDSVNVVTRWVTAGQMEALCVPSPHCHVDSDPHGQALTPPGRDWEGPGAGREGQRGDRVEKRGIARRGSSRFARQIVNSLHSLDNSSCALFGRRG